MSTTKTRLLVGLSDIAKLAGESYEKVRRMERDGLLPEPFLPKPYRSRWRRRDIESWLGIDEEVRDGQDVRSNA
ncbi:helix-turn-helix transcriptional regulator [Isoptericola rhizosphaerae]|uniref:helix-turn-helix transcriptional regulator n=1 Tax=Isoptericola rhizosphaerae TaxID=3377837 RepID=UPI00383B1D69